MGNAIKSRDSISQIVSFAGMDYGGKKSPSDIDGVLDWGGRLFIFYEVKFVVDFNPTHDRTGQVILFENLCNSIRVPAFALICEHRTEVGFDIILGNSMVRWSYSNQKKVWTPPHSEIKVYDATLRLLEKYKQ